MKHLRIVLAVLAVLLAALLWLKPSPNHEPAATDERDAAVEQPSERPTIPANAPSVPTPPQHPLARALASSETPAEKEPAIVLDLLDSWRRLHGRYPVAEDNAGLVRQLVQPGSNRPALLVAEHPRINARGEWTDAWGTPYFFHHVSGHRLDVRSAGPDREMYTADDLVVTGGADRAP